MKDKILIIGGCGYIGSVMTEFLIREGYEVIVIDNLIDNQWSLAQLAHFKKFHFIRGDVRDNDCLKKFIPLVDVIIDLAAYVGEAACRINPWNTMEINTFVIQKNILPNKSKDQLFLFPMTNSGYGTTDGTVYCTEETPLNPISIYGKSKVKAEEIILQYENTFSFRLATVFGMSLKMRWELLVNFYVYEAMRNRYLIIFEKNFKRNYIHVQDVAMCFEYAIRNSNNFKYHVYNLGLESANLSKEELAFKIKEHLPDLYIHFNDIETDIDKRNYIVSNARILSEGFKTNYTIDDGIDELIKGFNLMAGERFKNV